MCDNERKDNECIHRKGIYFRKIFIAISDGNEEEYSYKNVYSDAF